MSGPGVEVKDLWKSYPATNGRGERRDVLAGVNLTLRPNEFVGLYGPNGAGKTTIIRILAALEAFDRGEVHIDGVAVDHARGQTPPGIVVVSQHYDLFDWKTVRENVEFGLKARGVRAAERRVRAQRYLELVELAGHEDKYPYQLSGGLKQRTALARALVVEPRLVLIDEGFAALDTQVRRRLQELVLEIWEREKQTLLLVTHDPEEAVLMSDRVVVLSRAPAVVKKEVEVGLPRPRRADMRFEREFQRYLEELESISEDEEGGLRR